MFRATLHPILATSPIEPTQRMEEDLYKELAILGNKVLSYLNQTVPTNSPRKAAPKKQNLLFSDISQLLSSKLQPHPIDAEIQQANQDAQRHYSELMDVGHSLLKRIKPMALSDFICFAKNWNIKLENEQNYKYLKTLSVVELLAFMYLINRYPHIHFSRFLVLQHLHQKNKQDGCVAELIRLDAFYKDKYEDYQKKNEKEAPKKADDMPAKVEVNRVKSESFTL